jgi:hypothetical protein
MLYYIYTAYIYYVYRLRVSKNRVLRKIFGPKRGVVTGSGEDYIMRTFMIQLG